jgi:hypothetical protein
MKFLLLLFSFVLLFSCSITKKTEKELYGKWLVTSVTNESIDIAPESFRNLMNDMLSNSNIEINKDHSYTYKILNKIDIGSWKLSDDTKSITFIDKQYRFDIVQINDSALIINQIRDNEKLSINFKKVIE